MKRLVALFLTGAVGMSLCDRVHIAYGVLTQRGWTILGQAWWVLPLFGFGGVGMVVAHRLIRRALGEPMRPAEARWLAASAALGGGVYVVTGPLQHWPVALSLGLLVVWALRAAWRRSKATIVCSIFLGLAGPLLEATIAAIGGHTYAHPDLLGVPMWLPGIYLHGGLLAADAEPFTLP